MFVCMKVKTSTYGGGGGENPDGIPLVPMKFLVIRIGYTQKSG